jgi:8-oxo-dGTP diphosphatase
MNPPHASTIVVSAGVLIEHGRVLLTQRKAGSHLAGAWEFPGGKVEPGEDPRDALTRELLEELGIETAVHEVIDVTFHRYPERAVLLLFYRARRVPRSPEPRARARAPRSRGVRPRALVAGESLELGPNLAPRARRSGGRGRRWRRGDRRGGNR